MEELEKELKDLKAEQYDMQSAFDKYKKEMEQRIAELGNKIAEVKGTSKEEIVENDNQQDAVITPTEQQDTTEVKVDDQQEPVVEDSNPVIVPDNQPEATPTTSVVESNVVGTDPIQVATEVATTPMAEGIPVIQLDGEKVEEANPGQQLLEQPPLTPTVEGIMPIQGAVVEQKQPDKKVFVKIDNGNPKAILLNTVNTEERLSQASAARKSKEMQERWAFGENVEMVGPVIEMPTGEQSVPTTEVSTVVEIPTVEQPSIVTPIESNNDLEIMMQKQQEAYAAGDMKTAEAIGNELIKKRESMVA